MPIQTANAAIAQLRERQTEDLEVPSSILGCGTLFFTICWLTLKQRRTPGSCRKTQNPGNVSTNKVFTNESSPTTLRKSRSCYTEGVPPQNKALLTQLCYANICAVLCCCVVFCCCATDHQNFSMKDRGQCARVVKHVQYARCFPSLWNGHISNLHSVSISQGSLSSVG